MKDETMRKFIRFISYLILIISLSSTAALFAQTESSGEPVTVVLVHPHAGLLRSYIQMAESGVIDIPNLEFLAVYYEGANYHVDALKQSLPENCTPPVRFLTVKGNLQPGNLFTQNDCSDDFLSIFRESDAVLFQGGPDIPPEVYGEETSLLTRISDPERHYFELSFLFNLLGSNRNPDFIPLMEENPGYVIYAFCLGAQTINVATGGSLYQDIPSEIYGLQYVDNVLAQDRDQQHRNYRDNLFPKADLFWSNFHRIRFIKDRFFVTRMQRSETEQPFIVSSHHQAVEQIGRGLVVAATSLDGKVIEALEHEKYPNVLGVQFHPEHSECYNPEGHAYQISPTDTNRTTYYESLVRLESQEFHRNFWEYFSTLLKDAEK